MKITAPCADFGRAGSVTVKPTTQKKSTGYHQGIRCTSQNILLYFTPNTVFVNRKVLQKGAKKVSTFNTLYTCSDCMSRAPTLTFWCANRSSPFARVRCAKHSRPFAHLLEPQSPFSKRVPLSVHGLRKSVTLTGENHDMAVVD